MKNKFFLVCSLFVSFVSFINIFWRGSGIFEIKIANFMLCTSIIVIPYFVRTCTATVDIKKIIFYFIVFLFSCNFLIVFSMKLTAPKRLPFGLPGNTNWQAILAVAFFPIIVWGIVEYIPYKLREKKITIILVGFVILMTGWLEYSADSKGARLALLICSIIFIVGQYGERVSHLFFQKLLSLSKEKMQDDKFLKVEKNILSWNRISDKYINSVIVLSVFGLGFILVAVAIISYNYDIKLISNDIRRFLWSGSVELLVNSKINYFFGVANGAGEGAFESAFASFNSLDYYLTNLASDRNNHPHSQLLYLFLSYGVVVASLLLVLLFKIYSNIFKNFSQKSWFIKAVTISSLMLLVHGMVDLVLFEWPTNIVFLILIGILANEVFPFQKTVCTDKHRNGLKSFVTIFLTVILLFEICQFSMATYIGRKGRCRRALNNYQGADSLFAQSLKKYPRAQVAFDAMYNAFFNLSNLSLTEKYYGYLRDCGVENYSHNNLFMCVVKLEENRDELALIYVKREIANFPAEVMPVLLEFYIYNVRLNDNSAALISLKNLERNLELKIKDKHKLGETLKILTSAVRMKNFSPYQLVKNNFRKK
ncbi:hypothetical protein AAEX28_08690 [Lentisphaerota bacterium WC36G]|nr:hypothetical protein LJT99_11545 [Lentisphaerae bacterium WC36]